MNPVSTIHYKLSARFYWFFTIRRVAFPVNGSDCTLFCPPLFFEFRLRRGRITRSQWTFLNEILLPQRASLRTSAGLRYERTYFSLIYLNVFITDILAQSWQVELSKNFEDNLLVDIYFHLFIHRNYTGLGHFFKNNRENSLILLEVTNSLSTGWNHGLRSCGVSSTNPRCACHEVAPSRYDIGGDYTRNQRCRRLSIVVDMRKLGGRTRG